MQARADPSPSKCLAKRSRAKPFVRNTLHSSMTASNSDPDPAPAAAADACQSTEGVAVPDSVAEQATRATSAAVLRKINEEQ